MTSVKTADSLLDLIGNTPLVRLQRVVPKDCAQVWVKCEHYNPGGSIKDRIAFAMIAAAEREGGLGQTKTTVVEPTSGNTGIGLALVCAAKRYKLILCMPESMSLERRALLKSYGAQIELTPAADNMQGAVQRARELAQDPAVIMLDQFRNRANPLMHEQTTGPEITAEMGDKPISAFVSGIGTGGTITGVGRHLKQLSATRGIAETTIVGIEPANSAVIRGGEPGLHKIQGMGAGFIPEVLDSRMISEMRTIEDTVAYSMSRRLAMEEGLLVGISSGANVAVACDIAAELGPGKHVVTILCDTGERYFSLGLYGTSPTTRG